MFCAIMRVACDAVKQRYGGGTQIDADGVYAVFDHRIQFTGQSGLAGHVDIGRRRWISGSIFTSSASAILQTTGDRDRAAQETSRSGNSRAASSEAEYNGRPRFASTITFCAVTFGEPFLYVEIEAFGFTREAVPLPIATSSDVVFFAQRGAITVAALAA